MAETYTLSDVLKMGAAPDTLSLADVRAMRPNVADQIANDAISQGARSFPTDGGDFMNFVAGYGKAGADLARGIGQLIPTNLKGDTLVSRQDVADSRRLDAPLLKTKAGTTGNVFGNLVDLAPAAMLPGAATVLGGAAYGFGTGLIQPSASTGETLMNTGLGTAAGAVIPLAQRLWQVGKAVTEPLSQPGKERIVGRALNAAAGKDAPAVAQRLADVSAPFVGPSQGVPRTIMGEYVPGSLPTVGQAAENAGMAALERSAAAGNPAVTSAIADTMKAQNIARTDLLTEMAGSSGARDFFDANRRAAAQQLYEKAYRAGLPPFTPEQQAVVADLMSRPAIKGGHMAPGAMDEARLLAKNEGIDILDPSGSVKGLDYVKRALDDKIAKASGNEQRILMGIKDKLVGLLDEVSPNYAAARRTFTEMSRPLNQMDVAQEIANRSINKLTGNLQPASYARALSDKTAQQATGFGKATLEGVMDSPQMNQLNSILLDVQRANGALNGGRGPGSDTLQKLAYTNLMDQSGLPTFVQNLRPAQIVGNLLARGADTVYGRANREMGTLLAETMLDPQKASLLMIGATPAQRSKALGLLGRAAQGTLLAAPPAVYALQQ